MMWTGAIGLTMCGNGMTSTWSGQMKRLLTVITLVEDNVVYGVNGWRSSETDIKRYGGGLP
ncbi:MAG: hypothetical protein ACR2FO_00440 [Actinomycetota bacterium]